eukprot:UN06293
MDHSEDYLHAMNILNSLRNTRESNTNNIITSSNNGNTGDSDADRNDDDEDIVNFLTLNQEMINTMENQKEREQRT